jgi:hypothetical protein
VATDWGRWRTRFASKNYSPESQKAVEFEAHVQGPEHLDMHMKFAMEGGTFESIEPLNISCRPFWA